MSYTNQIFKAGRSNAVFVVDAFFGKNEETPLELYAGWSRFTATIIDKRGAKTAAPFFNIPIADFEIIAQKVKHLCMQELTEKFTPAENNTTTSTSEISKLLDVKPPFKYKSLKDGLVESGGFSGIDKVIEIFIKGYNSYAINKKIVDNLRTLKTFDEKEVEEFLSSKGSNLSESAMAIYETPSKVLLSRKPSENGDNFCYEASIIYNRAMKQRFTVNISNFYAPVTKNENGLMNVMTSGKHDENASRFNLSSEEMLEAVNAMERVKRAYEVNIFNESLALANKLRESNIENNR